MNWKSVSVKIPGPGNITLLNPTSYLTQRALVRENNTSLVHVADIHSPLTGARQAFIKTFPTKFVENGLANELIGYLLAREGGLPVADEAYILILPSELLFRCHSDFKSDIATTEGYNVVWATSAVDGYPLKYLHPLRDPSLRSRLLKWPGLPTMLAFDDLVANQDRTEDNLVCIHNGSMVLVDHADIAGGISRQIEYLDPSVSVANMFIRDAFEGSVPNTVTSGMILAAERHPLVVQNALPHIAFWLQLLFPNTPERTSKLLDFLQVRADGSADRIREHYGILI